MISSRYTYAMATRMLVEAQARAPIAALRGDGSTSSSERQHFPSAGRAGGVSTVNLRYGGEPGVKLYTHVSDQFAPFATRAIAAALAEIGRIERSVFTLEWMLEPDLRHRVQTGLNEGVARNSLARAVFPNRLGQMHDRTCDDQQRRATGCNDVVAAITLWNNVYLAAAVGALRRSGVAVPDDLLRHVWPLGWDHVSLTGDHRRCADKPTALDQLRPLRLERLGARNPA
jgi:TnpA family transposase